ncbi:cysteate racemase [Marinisporobacter balticus]|uniref:Aspartate racemase n=1 Tax=Marinisporobacter balticus TaxID=2018667 RepID=A0A4R2KR78_9FIRM|nr:amino acid racemase [Marinisporobacter balticus]TCO75227.1 aspartate racemase [Marinisporobacter balticus]
MKKIGILGGMGPLATADLFKKIVLLTDANSDNEHIPILIDNNTEIPDRTEHIINNGEDPTMHLIKSAIGLEKMGADVIIMPCNTAHYFYEKIIKYVDVPFLHMIEETAKEIKSKYPNVKKIGLLATEGTYQSLIYDKIFEKYDLPLVKPKEGNKKYIMELIYNIKKGKMDMDLTNFKNVLKELKEDEVDIFILGCTELPVAFEIFEMDKEFACVDPTKVLAYSAIQFVGKKVNNK